MGSTAPADGLSHPLAPAPRTALRVLNRAIMGMAFRKSIEGPGEIPSSGPVIMCPTHQSPWDATLVDTLTWRDVRYMAAEEQFVGLRGKAMTWGGAFPVDRGAPGSTPLRHSVEVLHDGRALCMFPEGKIVKNGHVSPLKGGVGRIAAGSADSIIPIAMRLQKDDQERPLERLAGYVASAALVGAGLAATAVGGPTLRTVAGAVTGALAGAWLLGHAGAATTPSNAHPTFGPLLRSLKFGALGLAAGAVAGALGSTLPAVGLATSLCSGGAALAIARHMRTRPLARFHIGNAIEVAPYVAKHGKKAAGDFIVADLQQSLLDGRAALGMPAVVTPAPAATSPSQPPTTPSPTAPSPSLPAAQPSATATSAISP